MGVYKNGNAKVWWISWNEGGKQRRESARTTNRKEAEALLAAKKGKAWRRAQFPDLPEDKALRELKTFWLDYAASKRSLKKDKEHFKKLEAFWGEKRMCSTLKPEDILAFRKAHTSLGPASQNRVFEVLRAALRAAGLPVPKIRRLPENNKRDVIVGAPTLRKLMEASNPAYRCLLVLGYYTGARQIDLRTLRWKDINLQKKTVRIFDQKIQKERLIPLHDQAVEALKHYKTEWPTEKRYTCKDDNVFPWKTSTNLSKYHERVRRKAKVQGVNFHDLRHTTATMLRQAGVDTMTTMRMLGHTSMQTAARYQTVESPELRVAVKKLARV